jgi:ABC-type nitrate/sulfonate/bicarbonate transport system permease component
VISTLRRQLPALAGIGALIVVWVIGGKAGWANGMVVTPSEAIRPITAEGSRQVYWRATRATAGAAGRGLLIGAVIGIVGAMVASGIPPLRRVITRVAALSNATPWVVVGPCLLIILGRDRGPAGLAAIAALFPIFVSTYVGLVSTPPAGLDVVRAHGASSWTVIRTVRLPAALPSLVDGLRLAAPAALAGAVFGEWYGAPRGLGVLLVAAMQGARPERLWAASLLAVALASLLYLVLGGVSSLISRRWGVPATASISVPKRHIGWRRVALDTVGVVAFALALVGLWSLWIHAKDISPIVVPPPSRVFDDLANHPGAYLAATGHTLATSAIALLIGAAFALVAAALAGWSRFLAALSVPVVVGLAATPLVALFPLLARVLGYGPGTVRALAAVMVFFPVFVHSRSGLLGTPAGQSDVLRSLGAGRWTMFRRLVLPAALPRIATGLRLAVGSSVVAAVVGESLIGRHGLGVEFIYAYNLLDLPRAFGAALVIVVVSLGAFSAATAAESALHARWS